MEAVAALHATGIAEGFISNLGSRFQVRLYRRVLRSRQSFALVAISTDGLVCGFVAGSTRLKRLFAQFAVRDALAAAVTSPIALTRSVPKLVETLRYGVRRAVQDETTADGVAELLAIAVASSARRQGIGSSLVSAFLAEAQRLQARSARVVVGADNQAAVALYKCWGFEPEAEFELHRGTRSLAMHLSLTRP